MPEKKQARAPQTHFFGAEAFEKQNYTQIRWLGNAGVFINARGICLMVDPLLLGFDMPLLIEPPVVPGKIPAPDAVLITHSDNDHYDPVTNKKVKARSYHAPHYVAGLMREQGVKATGHNIGDIFKVGDIKVTLTPADHAWQNSMPGEFDRRFQQEDFCGFWLDTPDGSIWIVGDSRLMKEHLQMPAPDVMFFDFSNNSWHIGLDNAVKLANIYPETQLILYHWGSVDAPDMDPFNADPRQLEGRVVNPQRIKLLAPGEIFSLSEK